MQGSAGEQLQAARQENFFCSLQSEHLCVSKERTDWGFCEKASDAVNQKHSNCKHRGWLLNCGRNCQVGRNLFILSLTKSGICCPVTGHQALPGAQK